MVVELLDFVSAFLVETMFLEPGRVSRMFVAAGPLRSEVRRETWNWLRLITRTDPASISQERT